MREVIVGLGVITFASVGAWVHPPAPSVADEDATIVTSFVDDRIDESSGLVIAESGRRGAQPVTFATTNDSGDAGRLYVVEASTGETVRVVDWSEAPTDVEALAPAEEGVVWVGDIGDNGSSRESIEVARVSLTSGDAASYELVYPDGAHDAETLLAHPVTQRLYVVTKSLLGGAVYSAPQRLRSDRANQLRRVETVGPGAIGRLVTDGAFSADGRSVVLRTYTRARVLRMPGWRVVEDIELPSQPQGEALALDRTGRIYLSSEGRGQPILRVPAPLGLRHGGRPGSATTSGPTSASQGNDSQQSDRPTATVTTSAEDIGWPRMVGIGTGVLAVSSLLASASLRRRRREAAP